MCTTVFLIFGFQTLDAPEGILLIERRSRWMAFKLVREGGEIPNRCQCEKYAMAVFRETHQGELNNCLRQCLSVDSTALTRSKDS